MRRAAAVVTTALVASSCSLLGGPFDSTSAEDEAICLAAEALGEDLRDGVYGDGLLGASEQVSAVFRLYERARDSGANDRLVQGLREFAEGVSNLDRDKVQRGAEIADEECEPYYEDGSTAELWPLGSSAPEAGDLGDSFFDDGNVFDLTAGVCFDDTDEISGGEVSDVPVVDCSKPHDNEVFHTFELDDGDFPGDEALTAHAQEVCIPAFEEYVGTDYASSRLDVFPITPTAGSWDGGDREIVCALYDLELAKLEGSMKGSGE